MRNQTTVEVSSIPLNGTIKLSDGEYKLLNYLKLLRGGRIKRHAVSDLRFNAELLTMAFARKQTLPQSMSRFTANDIAGLLILAKKIEDS